MLHIRASTQRSHCEPRYLTAPANINRFFDAHVNRQGIAVLAFEVGSGCLQDIYRRYHDLHPQLLVDRYKEGIKSYDTEADVLEVFAYYKGEKGISLPDEGTILRFMETKESSQDKVCKLPGILSVPAKFHASCSSAYFDHWVSNGECNRLCHLYSTNKLNIYVIENNHSLKYSVERAFSKR